MPSLYFIDFVDSIHYIDFTDFIDFIDFTWFCWFYWLHLILLIPLLLLILLTLLDFIDFIDSLHPYENKPNYLSSRIYLLSCNVLWILFILCFIKILLNKTSTYFFLCVFLTIFLSMSFVFLISLLFAITKDYIFDFNSTNSLIIFPLTSSFILPITFLWQNKKSLRISG